VNDHGVDGQHERDEDRAEDHRRLVLALTRLQLDGSGQRPGLRNPVRARDVAADDEHGADSLTARPKPAKIAVAIPYRASFRTTRARRGACRRARARRRGRRRQPRRRPREADRRDRRRREYELRHDHRLSGEDELKRPERSLIRDREQDQEADDHAGKPHSRVDDGLHDPLARELGEPDYDGDGNAEQCAQRHGGDAHVQRDVDDAPDVAVPEREIEEGREQLCDWFDRHAHSSDESLLQPSGTYCWKSGFSEIASGKNSCSPFIWYSEIASWVLGLVIHRCTPSRGRS